MARIHSEVDGGGVDGGLVARRFNPLAPCRVRGLGIYAGGALILLGVFIPVAPLQVNGLRCGPSIARIGRTDHKAAGADCHSMARVFVALGVFFVVTGLLTILLWVAIGRLARSEQWARALAHLRRSHASTTMRRPD